MIIIVAVAFILGFLLALKLPFALALAIIAVVFVLAVHVGDGVEYFLFVIAPMMVLWMGAAVGWIYYYFNYQTPSGLTVDKVLTWFVTP